MLIQAVRQYKVLPLLMAFLSGSWIYSQTVWASTISRIIPQGRVEAYSGDRVVKVYTQEAPFPEGYMLKASGRCGVRLDGFYLVADDQSLFGIHHQGRERVLTIERGMVYFALSNLPGQLVFRTPEGVFPAQQIVVQAAANQGVMKAYLYVRPDRTEIGVLGGGHMTVATPEGDRRITPGQQITIAQALIFDEEGEDTGAGEATETEQPPQEAEKTAEAPKQTPPKPRTGVYVGIGLAAVAIIGGAMALGGGGGGGSGGSGGGGGGGNGSVSPVD